MDQSCTVCHQDCHGHLQCSKCEYQVHYFCALGFDPGDEFKSLDLKSNFVCAPCVVGSSYDLLHLALDAHSKQCRLNASHFVASHLVTNASNTSVSSDISSIPPGQGSPVQGLLSPLAGDITSVTSRDQPSPNAGDTSENHRDESQFIYNAHRRSVSLSLHHHTVHNSNIVDASAHNSDIVETTGRRHDSVRVRQYSRSSSHDRVEAPHRHQFTPEDFQDIHEACEAKGKKYLYMFKNLLHLPDHATILLLGDSIVHCINKRDVDRETDSFRARSVGGGCVVAAVQALMRHNHYHPKIKRVIWNLGTNDHLHRAKHNPDESAQYLKALEGLCSSVFPNASISFVLPYRGMKAVDNKAINNLEKALKENCPKMKRYRPPNLHGMVDNRGVHPNREGKAVLTEFFSKTFVSGRQKVFKKSAAIRRPGTAYSQAHLAAAPTNHSQQVYQPSAVAGAVPVTFPPPNQIPVADGRLNDEQFRVRPLTYPSHPAYPGHYPPLHNQAVFDIADALNHVMLLRRSEPAHYSHQSQR